MTTNIGTLDRVLRAALGAVLLYLAFLSGLPVFADPLFRYGLGVVGTVMLATSILRVCPLYTLLGLKTCRTC